MLSSPPTKPQQPQTKSHQQRRIISNSPTAAAGGSSGNNKKKKDLVMHGNFLIDTSTVINKGRNAVVVRGTDLIQRRPVAVKIYTNPRAAQKDGVTELAVLNYMQGNSAVPKCFGAFEDSGRLFIVMELGKSDLWSLVSQLPEPMGEDAAKILFGKISKAVKALHKKGICHGDIKLENILYDRVSQRVTLIDFGTSCFLPQSAFSCSAGVSGNVRPVFEREEQLRAIEQLVKDEKKADNDGGEEEEGTNEECDEEKKKKKAQRPKPLICGKTLGYIAPESLLLAPEHCEPASGDVYALGVVLYSLVFQRLPVADMVGGYYEGASLLSLNPRRRDVVVGAGASLELRDLLYGMLHTNPAFRPTLDQVISHPWMKKVHEV